MLNHALLLVSLLVLSYGIVNSPLNVRRFTWVGAGLLSGLAAYSLLFYLADYFTGKGIDEAVLYHLQYGIDGAGYGEYTLLFITTAALIITSIVAAYKIAEWLVSWPAGKTTGSYLKLMLSIALGFLLSPTTVSYANTLLLQYSYKLGAEYYDFDEYYRAGTITSEGERKNLIYIYAEGLERTYFNEQEFPGLITNLRELEDYNTTFTNISQVWGTSWTIAGMTATQCGIPLVTASHANSMSGIDDFLPNARCMGDLLKDEGYRLTFLSGSSTAFAGTGKFLNGHGFDTVQGYPAIQPLLPDSGYRSSWGLFDDSLLEITFQEATRLAEREEPFGLFIATMDTHPPGKSISRTCDGLAVQNDSDHMLSAVKCADYLIAGFIRKVLASEFAKNTVIVITSDHLAMENSASDRLNRLERRNLFLVIEAEHKARRIDRPGTMLDVAPTVLPILGFKANLGLGRNLLSNEVPLVTQIPRFTNILPEWKPSLLKLWDFPKVNDSTTFSIDAERGTLKLDGRSFDYPVLVEIDDNGNTRIRFESDNYGSFQTSLESQVTKLESDKAFIWVDSCADMATRTFRVWEDLCVMYGRASSGGASLEVVNEPVTLPIKAVTGQKHQGNNRYAQQVYQLHEKARYIAHAGGAIGGHTYTNSLEALDSSYRKGFRLFELDIIKTSDEAFVAAHDWVRWQKITGYSKEIPPTLADFKNQKIFHMYTPLAMNDINEWFSKHPDALLITDKVNEPAAFASQFIDKDRLIMELFSLAKVREGINSGVGSAMPTWTVLDEIEGDKVAALVRLGVKHVAASRYIIPDARPLLENLMSVGIRVYVFDVNLEKDADETYVVCNEFEYIYGIYADKFDFNAQPACRNQKIYAAWLERQET